MPKFTNSDILLPKDLLTGMLGRYQKGYPNHIIPDVRIFSRRNRRLCETWSLIIDFSSKGAHRTVRTPDLRKMFKTQLSNIHIA